ncbi:MAG: hypothetical protein ACOYOK_09740 [Pseudobdellovibrionaceae bacterium]
MKNKFIAILVLLIASTGYSNANLQQKLILDGFTYIASSISNSSSKDLCVYEAEKSTGWFLSKTTQSYIVELPCDLNIELLNPENVTVEAILDFSKAGRPAKVIKVFENNQVIWSKN